ncbi:MAG: hypothetical protein D6692_12885 [Planctomycetota bacterium]|nr:MAG: hypothetical protein D6692_12885 [Planctomycetota bacterium]
MKSIALMAVAGLASVATAQTLSVELTFDDNSIAVGETTTATLTAYFTGHPAGAYMSSINIDLIASDAVVAVSNVAAIAWNNPPLGFDGAPFADGANVRNVHAAQFSLIPPIVAGSPLLITTFTVTGTAAGTLSYSAVTIDQAPAPFTVTGGGFADPAIQFGLDAFSSETLTVTPAPSAMALLGLGGLVAGRRRR